VRVVGGVEHWRSSRQWHPAHGANVSGTAGPTGWTRLSCHGFEDNQVRLQLFVLAYNLGNFLRRLALPTAVKHWSLTTMRDKLVKIGAKIVRHARYVTFQLAEVAVPHNLFKQILNRIKRLGVPPPVAVTG
jgi:hypothetical protein